MGYDPANPGEPSDDEEDLVIDDKKDTENIPLPDELTDIPLPVDEAKEEKEAKPNKIKISLTTTSATLGHPTPSPSKESPKQPASSPIKESPKKKNIIKDIFGSDEEDDADIPQEEKDLEVSKGESDTESKERKEEKLSDVSDQDINDDDDDDAASRDLSVSPINSEQSESFEKAATWKG